MMASSILTLVLVLVANSGHLVSAFRPLGFKERFFEDRVLKTRTSRFLQDETLLEACERYASQQAQSGANLCECSLFSDGVVEYECLDTCHYCDRATPSCGNYTYFTNLTRSTESLAQVTGTAFTFQYDGNGGRAETLRFDQFGCEDGMACEGCRVYVNDTMCNSCVFCPEGRNDGYVVDCENVVAGSSYNSCVAPPGAGIFQGINYAMVSCEIIEPPISPPPENDACVNATTVAIGDVVTGTLGGALEEGNSVPSCLPREFGITAGVWYAFEGTGVPLLVTTCTDYSSQPDFFNDYSETLVTVFQGSDCDFLECVQSAFQDPYCGNSGSGGTSVTLLTETGVMYYIFVSDKYGYFASFELSLIPIEAASSECENAVDLDPDSASIIGAVEYSPGTLSACSTESGVADAEAWYKFTAAEGATYRASTCSQFTVGWSTSITVVEGDCDNQVCIAESLPYNYFSGCGDNGNIIDFQVTAGNDYKVVVWGTMYGAGLATVELELRALDPPANDECDAAEIITEDSVFTASLKDASTSLDELDFTCSQGYRPGTGGIWYSFVGTGDFLQATACSNDINIVMSIFSGSCGGLKCEGAGFHNYPSQECSMYSYGHRSNVVETVVGETYYVLVASSDIATNSGDFDFSMRSVVPAENDDCNGAIQISPDGSLILGSTNDAIYDGLLGCQYSSRAPGLWYVVVGTGGFLKADTCSEATDVNFDSVISVFRGICGQLECVAANDDGCGTLSSSLGWESEPFVNYYIRVHGLSDGVSGDFGLTVSEFLPAVNDGCDGAIELAVGSSQKADMANASGYDGADCYFSGTQPSLWYYIEGTGSPIEISTCPQDDLAPEFQNSTISVGANVFIGSSCFDLLCVPVAASSGDCYSSGGTRFIAEAGLRYYIMLTSWGGYGDTSFTITVNEFEVADNDVCDTAQRIDNPMDAFIVGSTSKALIDNSTCAGLNYFNSPGVWYSVIGTGDAFIASTCSSELNFDASVSVYTGTCADLECLNYDASYGLCDINFYGAGSVIFRTEPEVEYFILVAGQYDSAGGDFGLTLAKAEPPENDMCSTATVLVPDSDMVLGSIANATASFESTNFSCFYQEKTAGVWYSLAGTGEVYAITTCSRELNFDAAISISSGSCDEPECVAVAAYNDYSCPQASWSAAKAVLRTEVGVDYFIYVHGAYAGVKGTFGLSAYAVDVPPNDVCSSATPITPDNGTVFGSIEYATASFESTNFTCLYAEKAAGVWYSLAGDGKSYAISTCSRELNFDAAISISSGSCDEPECVTVTASNYLCPESTLSAVRAVLRTEVGVDYFIYVHSAYPDAAGMFGLSANSVEIPPNDVCSSATPITANNGTVVGSTADATNSGSDGCFTFSDSPDVWFSVEGTGTSMTASLCGETDYDSQLAVFEGVGDDCSTNCVDYNDDFCGLRSAVSWQSVEGVTYYIRVYGLGSGTSGNFELEVTARVGSADNDQCSDAIPLESDVEFQSVLGDTSNASATFVDSCGAAAAGGSSPDVWYSIMGNGSTVSLSTCSEFTDFDTMLSVFTGSCDSPLCVDGADDDGTCVPSTSSQLSFFGEVDVTYYIRVNGFSEAAGSFELLVFVGEGGGGTPPVNDQCPGATSLVIPDLAYGDTSDGATPSGAPVCSGSIDSETADVWYTVTGNGETLLASTCGVNAFDSQISIYAGSCDSLVCVASNDDGGLACGTSSQVQWFADVGTTYYVRVHGYAAFNEGYFELSISSIGDGGQSETSDVCASAVGISVFSDTSGSTVDASPDPLLTWCGEATSVVSNGVWYKIVGDGSSLLASTCNSITNFDTQISVFTGECSDDGAAMALLECVDGNDQYCGDQSQVEFSTMPGVTYYILVHGHLSSSGSFVLSLYPAEVGQDSTSSNVKETASGEAAVPAGDKFEIP